MSQQPLDSIEIEPSGDADCSIIWLHGLGADGNDFVPIVPELKLPDSLPIRFVFPHAPVRPVTLNAGMPMRAWYDIYSLGKEGNQDEAGIRDCQKQIDALIQRELDRGIAADRILLAGFSQGGSMALHTGLRSEQRLAGIIALSTWLPLHTTIADEASEANRGNAILMCHGDFDPMVPCDLGAFSRDFLSEAGYSVEWHSYPMEHQVCLEEISAIGNWIQTRLKS